MVGTTLHQEEKNQKFRAARTKTAASILVQSTVSAVASAAAAAAAAEADVMIASPHVALAPVTIANLITNAER